MTYEKPGLDAFVPFGEDAAATARLLVDLADKHGISQNDIHTSNDGFYVSEDLADLIGSDSEEDEPGAGDGDPYDPIAADRERIREAEEGAVYTQASALATVMTGQRSQEEADARVAAQEAESAQQAEDKAALAVQESTGPNPYDETEDDDVTEPAEEEETETVEEQVDPDLVEEVEDEEKSEEEAVAYEDMDYADLKALVDLRGLTTEDRKAETYIAALEADDAAKAEQSDDEVE